MLTYELEFTWQDGRRITMTDTGRNPHGVKFHGDKDWLFCRHSMNTSNRDLLRTPIDDLPDLTTTHLIFQGLIHIPLASTLTEWRYKRFIRPML